MQRLRDKEPQAKLALSRHTVPKLQFLQYCCGAGGRDRTWWRRQQHRKQLREWLCLSFCDGLGLVKRRATSTNALVKMCMVQKIVSYNFCNRHLPGEKAIHSVIFPVRSSSHAVQYVCKLKIFFSKWSNWQILYRHCTRFGIIHHKIHFPKVSQHYYLVYQAFFFVHFDGCHHVLLFRMQNKKPLLILLTIINLALVLLYYIFLIFH